MNGRKTVRKKRNKSMRGRQGRKTRTEDKDGRQYFYSRNPILDSVGGTGVQSAKLCFIIGTLAEPLNKGLESLQQKEQDFTRKLSIDCLFTM